MTKQQFDYEIGEQIKKLIARGTKQMSQLNEREWDKEDLMDENENDSQEWTNDDDYKEDLKDRYDQLKGN